jgi:hypothetical protein
MGSSAKGRRAIQMRNRVQAAGLALLILVVGIGLTVAVSEHEVGAGGARHELLTTADVVVALTDSGVELGSALEPAHHPLLSVTGATLTTGAGQIEVYVYPDVASRVADEQRIQRRLAELQAFATGDESLERITSARNVLLLFAPGSNDELARIVAAARDLADSDQR